MTGLLFDWFGSVALLTLYVITTDLLVGLNLSPGKQEVSYTTILPFTKWVFSDKVPRSCMGVNIYAEHWSFPKEQWFTVVLFPPTLRTLLLKKVFFYLFSRRCCLWWRCCCRCRRRRHRCVSRTGLIQRLGFRRFVNVDFWMKELLLLWLHLSSVVFFTFSFLNLNLLRCSDTNIRCRDSNLNDSDVCYLWTGALGHWIIVVFASIVVLSEGWCSCDLDIFETIKISFTKSLK